MPTLPNTVGAFSGATLNIKNLDVVNLETNDISCDTLTVDGHTISAATIDGLTTTLEKTQNITAEPGITTITGDLITTNAISFTSVEVQNDLTVEQNVIIYEDLDVGNHLLCVKNSETRVGVNTHNPTTTLTVNGNANVTSHFTAGTNVLYVNNSNARVGINTVGPSDTLDVNGTTTLRGTLNVDSGVLYVSASANMVGVNTTSPGHTLDVVGGSRITTSLIVDTAESPIIPAHFYVQPAVGITSGVVGVRDSLFSVQNDVSDTVFIAVPSSGYVGINTHNPQSALDIRGDFICKDSTGAVTMLDIDPTNERVSIRKAADSPYTLDINGSTRVRGSLYTDLYLQLNYPISTTNSIMPSDPTHVGYVAASSVSEKIFSNNLNTTLVSISLLKGVWLLNGYFGIANTSGQNTGSWNVNFYLYKSGTQELYQQSYGSFSATTGSNQTVTMAKVLIVDSASTTYTIDLICGAVGNSNSRLLATLPVARHTYVTFTRLA